MGQILVPLRRELKVNLDQFYEAVDIEDPDKIDRALEEFYLRVVVGMLTRTNKHYISQNPNRHTIFLKLIEELRVYIMQVRQIDRFEAEVTKIAQRRDSLLKSLQDPEPPRLRVGGSIGSDVVIQLKRLEEVREDEKGNIDCETIATEVKPVQSSEGASLELADSGEMVNLGDEELKNGTLTFKEGHVVWLSGG